MMITGSNATITYYGSGLTRKERRKIRLRRLAKKRLPRLLHRYRRRQYLAALALKRTRRPVVLIKPVFE
jgi:hypothetical protein